MSKHRKRSSKLLAIAVAAIAFVFLEISSATATAAPSNDTIGGATLVTSLPFNAGIDTTGATTDAQDAQVNASCGAPATNASVWYRYTAVAGDSGIVVDGSTSDYTVGIIVATGTPGALTNVGCGPLSVFAPVVPGTIYYVLVFDDTGTGGNLVLTIAPAPPPPTLSLTVNPRGTVDRTGAAHLAGTYTCTESTFVNMEVDLTQPVGRFSVVGFSFMTIDPATCNGSPQPWAATVTPFNGKFAGGYAANVTLGFACNIVQCAEFQTSATVHLRRSR